MPQPYTFNRKDKKKSPTENIEYVYPEKWAWEVTYKDGSTLKQFDDVGVFHQIKEIEQSKIHTFRMVCEKEKELVIPWEPGYKLIHFYRNTILDDGQRRVRLFCCGYEKDNTKKIYVITPDNQIIETDNIEKITVI
jgi:hypothetical protein